MKVKKQSQTLLIKIQGHEKRPGTAETEIQNIPLIHKKKRIQQGKLDVFFLNWLQSPPFSVIVQNMLCNKVQKKFAYPSG